MEDEKHQLHMTFSFREKQAIQSMIAAMVLADGRVDANEVLLNTLINEKIGIDTIHLEASTQIDLQDAVQVVKGMTYSEKRFVCAYLGTMMAIDNDIDPKERLLWAALSEACDFPRMSIMEAKQIIANL